MIRVRRAAERGHAQHGWLESFHTFSFAGYRDPAQMGFRDLRVINEDRVQPGRGFDTHSHRDMEIVSYVIDGALEHRDSLGNGSTIRPGDVQRMSAGTGVTHSEFNGSGSEVVHFLQIWILPEREGLPPSYEQKHFPREEREGVLRLVASREGKEESVRVHQDVSIYASLLRANASVEHELAPGRHAWLQVVRGGGEIQASRLGAGGRADSRGSRLEAGSVGELQEARLEAGDGAAISDARCVAIAARAAAELLLFDLA
jgi:hypothetical protein